jgi:hypothetical protein
MLNSFASETRPGKLGYIPFSRKQNPDRLEKSDVSALPLVNQEVNCTRTFGHRDVEGHSDTQVFQNLITLGMIAVTLLSLCRALPPSPTGGPSGQLQIEHFRLGFNQTYVTDIPQGGAVVAVATDTNYTVTVSVHCDDKTDRSDQCVRYGDALSVSAFLWVGDEPAVPTITNAGSSTTPDPFRLTKGYLTDDLAAGCSVFVLWGGRTLSRGLLPSADQVCLIAEVIQQNLSVAGTVPPGGEMRRFGAAGFSPPVFGEGSYPDGFGGGYHAVQFTGMFNLGTWWIGSIFPDSPTSSGLLTLLWIAGRPLGPAFCSLGLCVPLHKLYPQPAPTLAPTVSSSADGDGGAVTREWVNIVIGVGTLLVSVVAIYLTWLGIRHSQGSAETTDGAQV